MNKTIQKGSFEKKLAETNWYYKNPDINEKNFPILSTGEEKYKVIKMDKYFSSEEALERIKTEGCRPATAYDLLVYKEQHPEAFPDGTWTWLLAFGQLFTDSGGDRRVPRVRRHSDGDWEFSLGYFGLDWHSGLCLLCVCDKESSEDLTTKPAVDSLTLTDEVAIAHLKAQGYRITKLVEKEF